MPAPVIQSVLQFFRDWFERFVAVQGIDRAMAIAAQSYSAFLPLVIVYSATLPRGENEDFADVIVNRFELHGATAASVRQAFAPSGAVESSLTVLGRGAAAGQHAQLHARAAAHVRRRVRAADAGHAQHAARA